MTPVTEVTRQETVIVEGERLEIVEVARQGQPGPPGAIGDPAQIGAAIADWLATNGVPGVVRYDAEQTLAENERERARKNIGMSPIDCGVF
jgi:hypothetical protein